MPWVLLDHNVLNLVKVLANLQLLSLGCLISEMVSFTGKSFAWNIASLDFRTVLVVLLYLDKIFFTILRPGLDTRFRVFKVDHAAVLVGHLCAQNTVIFFCKVKGFELPPWTRVGSVWILKAIEACLAGVTSSSHFHSLAVIAQYLIGGFGKYRVLKLFSFSEKSLHCKLDLSH